jgi:hypothetical protein
MHMLDLLMSVTLTQNYFDRDPMTVPMPYNLLSSNRQHRLTIGYFDDDGFLSPMTQ